MIPQVALGDEHDAQVIDETSSSHTQLILAVLLPLNTATMRPY